ncbi:MAG: hypothetical protein V4671_04625 [Armatimonadota bacterium]
MDLLTRLESATSRHKAASIERERLVEEARFTIAKMRRLRQDLAETRQRSRQIRKMVNIAKPGD